jgi:hypothetical protein
MPAGRPLKYQPEELYQKFSEYIADCREQKKMLPNVAGFAFFADFDRDTYYEYAKRPEFADTIKRIEVAFEDFAINCKDPAKSIFYMKNKFGYRDKTEQEISGPNGGPIQVASMTDDELEKRLAELDGGK